MLEPFWEQPLSSLSHSQWEALCDGCGKCCLHKLQDEETDELYFTDVACRLLNDHVKCSDYAHRQQRVPECLVLNAENIESIAPWLPLSCAYRRRSEGLPLPNWHPLITGQPVPDSASVRGRVVSETEVSEEEFQERVVIWVDERV